MIEKIHIRALKSIRDLSLDCYGLNLFVGTNSSGKSTFLQALLLMAQNGRSEDGLNGRLVSLGEFREARNHYMPKESIRIEIWETGREKPAWIEFEEDKEGDSYKINSYHTEDGVFDIFEDDMYFDEEQACGLIDGIGFYYLSCHRIGARDIYKKNILEESGFGTDGEFAMAYLLKNESKPIDLAIKEDGVTDSLLEQVNYWLNYIIGITISINDLKKTNYLQVKYNNNPANASAEALHCRPVNVGAGVSYLISILITCLGSEKDSIIIIENPEIHLHPKAQSRLCEFLYFISLKERQLFVETHSDHIFNGIRAGIATGEMEQNNVTVHFFAVNDKYETQCSQIIFEKFGKIVGLNEEMDLEDLFEQFEIDIDRMLGI